MRRDHHILLGGNWFDVATFVYDGRNGIIQADGEFRVLGFGRRALRSDIPPGHDGAKATYHGFVWASISGGVSRVGNRLHRDRDPPGSSGTSPLHSLPTGPAPTPSTFGYRAWHRNSRTAAWQAIAGASFQHLAVATYSHFAGFLPHVTVIRASFGPKGEAAAGMSEYSRKGHVVERSFGAVRRSEAGPLIGMTR